MTYRPTEEEEKMIAEIHKWMYVDEEGNWLLREDAPEQIKIYRKKIKASLSRIH